MIRTRKLPATPEDAESSPAAIALDAGGEVVARVRAHVQTSLGSIESAVRALGLGGQPVPERERWRRVAALLERAVLELETARELCAPPMPVDPGATESQPEARESGPEARESELRAGEVALRAGEVALRARQGEP